MQVSPSEYMKTEQTLICFLSLAKPHQTSIANRLLNIFVVGLDKTIENRKEEIFTLVLFCDGAYLYVISCVPVNAFVCSLQEPSRAWID